MLPPHCMDATPSHLRTAVARQTAAQKEGAQWGFELKVRIQVSLRQKKVGGGLALSSNARP